MTVPFFILSRIQCCPWLPSVSQYVSGLSSVRFWGPSSSYCTRQQLLGEYYMPQNLKFWGTQILLTPTNFYEFTDLQLLIISKRVKMIKK